MPARKKRNAPFMLAHLKPVSAYLDRIEAKPRGLLTAVVQEEIGRYSRDVAVIRFDRAGSITAPPGFEPTDAERADIGAAIRSQKLPEILPLRRMPALPDELKTAPRDKLYEFKDVNGAFVMLQQRIDFEDGRKAYLAWTYWDDHKWRQAEPDGQLPLFGLDQLPNAATVFLHEGAKVAKYLRDLTTLDTPSARKALGQHGWGQMLRAGVHLGWVGGALSPHRTDFTPLNKANLSRVYIVSDNDDAGRSAVPYIAQQLRTATTHVQFTNDWPSGFDLADEFPATMFAEFGGERKYVGPSFQAVCHPSTWATDMRGTSENGRPLPVLRQHFEGEWQYVEEAEIFAYVGQSVLLRSREQLDAMYCSLSHTRHISTLVLQNRTMRVASITYRPDAFRGVITEDGRSALNVYTPSDIMPVKGDRSPWLEFLEYLFPDPEDRRQVERWCATLLAKPGTRMQYGMLLVSEAQGVGKTTLASHVLTPLVGVHNVRFPSEREIVQSDFNGYIAKKRLVVVAEIYAGKSWKAYNNLKALVTDQRVDVNEKFEKPYSIRNWAHFVASSNSKRALKIEDDDRRWLIPRVTEQRWAKEKFDAFYNWLSTGGLGIILQWARDYGDYVQPGEVAPKSDEKDALIEANRSEAQLAAAQLAHSLSLWTAPVAVAMRDIEQWVRRQVGDKLYDSQENLRRVMIKEGVFVSPDRLKVAGGTQYVIMNAAAWEESNKIGDLRPGRDVFTSEHREAIRRWLTSPDKVCTI